MGTLLVEAYESSVELSKSAKYTEQIIIDDKKNEYSPDDKEIRVDCVNIFKVPPPPFVVKDPSDGSESHKIYTIVPGQIAAAARRRQLRPCQLYGGFLAYNSDTTSDTWGVEESFYYKPYDEDYSDGDSSDDEDNAELPAACDTNEDGNDSDTTQQFSIPVKLLPPC